MFRPSFESKVPRGSLILVEQGENCDIYRWTYSSEENWPTYKLLFSLDKYSAAQVLDIYVFDRHALILVAENKIEVVHFSYHVGKVVPQNYMI